MDLGVGTKRLTNRKRAIPAKKVKEVRPEIQSGTLKTLIEPNIEKKFSSLVDDDIRGVRVSHQEKELISSKAFKQMKNLPTLEIVDINYVVMSDEELTKMAVFEAKNTDDEGLFSVNDPRSGTIDANILCTSCSKDSLSCPGHVGRIKLNEHIIHPVFRREVVDVLTSICGSCGGLLLPYDTIKEKGILNLTGSKRLRALAEASEKIPCRRNLKDEGVTPCIANPIYKTSKLKETGKIFYTRDEKSKNADNIRSVEDIEIIFDAISKEDAEIMGFTNNSHPSRFIMKSLAVVPLCARPPVYQDGMQMKDDLTSMYQDIIRVNNELAKQDLKESERENKVKSLIFSIEHMINNSDKKYRQGKKKAYQSIKDRIQGKEALIRDAIMGKRTNFSARTVIGPDPTLKFGQVRVPRVMAPYLTQHEIITPENLKKMTSLLRSGKITYITPYGGRLEGKRVKVNEKLQNDHTLQLGDEVDRWLSDGDYAVFNRQPTLHKQGMMGFEVVLGDPLTFGVHLGVTRAFNADFDGDESNLSVGVSEDARREIAGLMSATCNIMTAQTNNNVAGVVFDALTGSYILSDPKTKVDKQVFMEVIMMMGGGSADITSLYKRLDKYYVPRDSGRALLSAVFPDDFYYQKGETSIREGILISGRLDSSNIGTAHGSIIQALYKDYSQEVTVDFLTNIYWTAGKFMDTHGFSIGMDDCFLSGKDPQKIIEYEVQRASMLVKSMGTKLLDPLEEERREKTIRAYLDTAKGLGQKISKENLDEDNSFNIMAKGGAKGSTFNIAQITGILGQQFMSGQRMPETLSGGTRALPYFPEGELSPEARGFVTNSFLTGLSPAEFFFHAVASRVGVAESSNSISVSGHLHHKMVKSLEDIRVYEDGSVRNTAGVIYQFSYGEDGFDATNIVNVKTKTGNFTSFIDMKRVAGRINSKYGFNK